MCGFAGFLNRSFAAGQQEAFSILGRMTNKIIHRGPDDAGLWFESVDGAAVGLAHRRLSILELSPAGAQPMTCQSGRYVLVFNGEIYNHLDLRHELQAANKAPVWRGHSDTETLLAGFLSWGVEATLKRAIGMFAIALWDRQEQCLTLARDRMGEKPLYYGWQQSGGSKSFLFGSDLAALKAHPDFNAGVDRNALALYMRHKAIGDSHSIYQNVYKLQPGCILTLPAKCYEPTIKAYWSLPYIAEQGVLLPFMGSDNDAVDALEALLKDAVKKQMLSDVPLGAFLSGGIDSSTIVALMQSQSNQPVKTFTIGFDEEGYNEAVHAKAVAKHLGTEHTELYISAQQALDVIPKLPTLYSEPLADPSQIPTFLVSQLARQQVAVSLSGDAGDELFGGYTRYFTAQNYWNKRDKIPSPLRKIIASLIRTVPEHGWNSLISPIQSLSRGQFRYADIGNKLYKGADLLAAKQIEDLYLSMLSVWQPDQVVLGAHEPETYLRGNTLPLTGLNNTQRLMVLDAIGYLPNEVLVKVDRAAMGVSLETRAPMLDHRVVEFAWQLPQQMKMRGNIGKWALREVLYRHVPKELVERPKMGFGVPVGSWIRGPLRDWAEHLLDESKLRQQGFLNYVPIRKKWAEHLSCSRDWSSHIWTVLMFQAWLDEQ